MSDAYMFEQLFGLAMEDSEGETDSAVSQDVFTRQAQTAKDHNVEEKSFSNEVEEEDDEDLGDEDEEDDGGSDSDERPGKRTKYATASKLARQRRKKEMDELKTENQKLRSERSDFLKKIEVLESKVKSELGGASLEDLYENELLKEQIMLHAQFMASFQRMVHSTPSEKSAKAKIYKEGAEQASTILLGLLADSQRGDWHQATLPPLLASNQWMRMDIWFRFTDNLFEEKSGVEEGKKKTNKRKKTNLQDMFKKKRLQMRFDITFYSITPPQLVDTLRRLLIDQKEKLRLWGISDDKIELKPLQEELQDENTMLLYHRKHHPPPKMDRDIVFLFDQSQRKMTRSTLTMPKGASSQSKGDKRTVLPNFSALEAERQVRKRGRPVGAKNKTDKTLTYGEVQVDMLTRTSTTLLAGAAKTDDAMRISSPVMHGALVFEEEELVPDEKRQGDAGEKRSTTHSTTTSGDEGCDSKEGDALDLETRTVTRAIVIISNPQEFSEQRERTDWNSILRPDGTVNPRFAFYLGKLLRNIHSQYTASKAATASRTEGQRADGGDNH